MNSLKKSNWEENSHWYRHKKAKERLQKEKINNYKYNYYFKTIF